MHVVDVGFIPALEPLVAFHHRVVGFDGFDSEHSATMGFELCAK